LKAFLEAQAKNPAPLVSMQGDPVHPGPNGQLLMAAALLQGLGADGKVSELSVGVAGGTQAQSQGCRFDKLKYDGGVLTFERTDECLPFPIPDGARAVLPLSPTVLELSQYILKVSGLDAGSYQIAVDKKPVTVVSAKELEKGVNLTAFDKGPIADQGKAILPR
jgi:hypothetical protein